MKFRLSYVEHAAQYFKVFTEEVFRISLLLYVLLLVLSQFVPNFVTFNMNIVLVVALISGAGTALCTANNVGEPSKKFSIRDWGFVFMLGVIGAVLVYSKIHTIGLYALPISVLTGICIVLLPPLLMSDDL